MDISHHKFTNTKWSEPYTMSATEEHHILLPHHHLHQQPTFDHTQTWPYNNNINYLPILHHHQNSDEPTNPDSANLLPPPSPALFAAADQDEEEEADEELGAMKEMMFKIAAMQPVDIDPATIRRPRRRNVRISDDPQSIAARHRRERISEKIRILQRLVPGGTKMDTASMLDEAIRYVKFLKRQIRILQTNQAPPPPCAAPADDWVVATTKGGAAGTSSYMFGGGNSHDDGGISMCFNRKFIGD